MATWIAPETGYVYDGKPVGHVFFVHRLPFRIMEPSFVNLEIQYDNPGAGNVIVETSNDYYLHGSEMRPSLNPASWSTQLFIPAGASGQHVFLFTGIRYIRASLAAPGDGELRISFQIT